MAKKMVYSLIMAAVLGMTGLAHAAEEASEVKAKCEAEADAQGIKNADERKDFVADCMAGAAGG